MKLKYLMSVLALIGAFATAALFSANAAEKKYSVGASDTEIKIGHTTAYSGPVS